MPNAIIVYGSTMGNTETVANTIEDVFENDGIDVTVANAADISPDELMGYDIILFGSSTWGDGELQDDFIPFYEEVKSLGLEGKKGASFGCGDSNFPNYCSAVHTLEDCLRDCGVKIVSDPLKIDGDVDAKLEDAEMWAQSVAQAVL